VLRVLCGCAARTVLLAGCVVPPDEEGVDPEQVAACVTVLEETGGTLLIGSEGGDTMCTCIVRRVAQRLPDAAERWGQLSEEVASRFERRGLLGLVVDSTWLSTRAGALGEIGTAYLEALPPCREELRLEWSSDSGGSS
jgi:hypothetical protein